MTHRLRLTALPSLLAEAQYEPIGYRTVYEAARSCRIPAKMGRNGRWTFDPEDLAVIAERLGATAAYAA